MVLRLLIAAAALSLLAYSALADTKLNSPITVGPGLGVDGSTISPYTPQRCDGFLAFDGVTTATTTTFTSASANFPASAAGKRISIAGAGATQHIGRPTITSGGAAYAVGDKIVLAGGTGTTATTLSVSAVAAGVITDVDIYAHGSYSVVPAGTITQASTTGAGTGATFTATWLRDGLSTRIASVIDATTVVLDDAAGATASAVTWGYGSDYAAQINAAAVVGQVNLPPGVCGVASPINLDRNYKISGITWGASTLLWLGANQGGKILDAGDTAATNGIQFGVLEDVVINGAGTATTCGYLHGLTSWRLQNVSFSDCTEVLADVDASTTGSAGGFQNNTIIAMALSTGSASSGSAFAWKVGNGNAAQNAGFNRIFGLRILFHNNTAFWCGYSDNNAYNGVTLFRFGGGAGYAMDLKGDAGLASCQGNTFVGMANTTTAPIKARGGLVTPSQNNQLVGPNLNAVPITIDDGASLFCVPRTGTMASCSPWGLYASQVKMHSGATSGQINVDGLDGGVIVSGGNGVGSGANLELYGPTSGPGSVAFLDADSTQFRTQNGATALLTLDGLTGHWRRGLSATPALTSCGTSPVINGTDTAGSVTMGTGAPAACTITFATVYANIPHCVVTWHTNLATTNYAVTASAITLTQTATSSNDIDYICFARGGG